MAGPLPRIPEVAADGLAEEDDVLGVERLIQAPVLRDPLVVLGRRLERQHHVQGVAGDPHQAEHDEAHDPDGQETVKGATRDEPLHATSPTGGRCLTVTQVGDRWQQGAPLAGSPTRAMLRSPRPLSTPTAGDPPWPWPRPSRRSGTSGDSPPAAPPSRTSRTGAGGPRTRSR